MEIRCFVIKDRRDDSDFARPCGFIVPIVLNCAMKILALFGHKKLFFGFDIRIQAG